MDKKTKETILLDLNELIDVAKKIRERVVEADEVDNIVVKAWFGVKEALGLTSETPTVEEVKAKVGEKVDTAVDKTVNVMTDEADKVVSEVVDKLKASEADEVGKAAIGKTKDAIKTEFKDKISAKKEEVKAEMKK